MDSYRTMLTHFSQRYGKWLPEGHEGDAFVKERCAMAFDGMRVPLVLLPWLPSVMPAVLEAFSE
jgi:ribonuclease BN (tRNA processing enzyme)